ncbi:MAG: bacteriocin [Pseudomonadota bacterium]
MLKHFLLASAVVMTLAGCSEYSQTDRTLGGAGIGAATGAIIGGAATGTTGGALAGAAIGGAGGAVVGAATTPEACTATDARGRPLRDENGNPVMVKCP